MRQALSRACLTAMLALGTVMPVLGTLGLLGCGWTAAGVVLLLSALLGAMSVRRWTMALLGGVGLIAAALWLIAMGGIDIAQEVLRGILLHAAGYTAALPMIAEKTAVLLSVTMTVVCFGLTSRSVGPLPGIMVTLLAAMMLWLCSAGSMLLYLIPAVAASLTLAATSRYDEVRVTRVLPAMLVAAAVAIAAVPSTGVSFGPLKDAASEVRQRILDYLFFTEPRDVFSLAGEGFYPEGVGQLGGPASPNDTPVMMVYTPRVTYLRGAVKNEYTGRVWQDTTGGRRYLWVSPRWRQIRERLFDMGIVSETLSESTLLTPEQVTVRMLRESESSLFVPQRVKSLSAGGELVPYFNNSSEIFITRDLAQGDTYTVTASLVAAGEQGLDTILAACERSADMAEYERVRRDYTILPEHLQTQVFELAHRAIEGADTPYEKAFALQNFLRRACRYTLDVAPQPDNVDFVSNFLLVTHEGYCTYFASAMTVLCRMVGLPARYVEGFVATPDENGVALVTGKQAHAWTEVYFAGFGWLTFDATPPSSNHDAPPDDGEHDGGPTPKPSGEPGASPTEEPTPSPTPESSPEPGTTPTPSPTPSPTPEALPTPAPSNDPQTAPTPITSPADPPEPPAEKAPPPPWLWWLLALAALIGAGCARIAWTRPARTAARAKDEMDRWLTWMQALSEGLSLQGQRRERHESMSGYLRRLGPAYALIAECSSEVFYGGCVPTPEDTAAARAACEAVWKRLSPQKRLRGTLRRAFTPLKKRDFTKATTANADRKEGTRS